MAKVRGDHYIIGSALTRRSLPEKVQYSEAADEFSFEELFNHESIGRTACADNALFGCFFSFSYDFPDEGRPTRGGRRQNATPLQDEYLKEHKELIHRKYHDYLASYSDCPFSQLENTAKVEPPTKVLLWDEVSSVTEMRETILQALEHFGIPCDKLWEVHDTLKEVESSADRLMLVAAEASEDEELKRMMQNKLSQATHQGMKFLLSFEAELKTAEEMLRESGVSLRFLFFAPPGEYQKIKNICTFLPQQIKSVLCVASIGYGHKPELQFFMDKRLEKAHELAKDIIYIIERSTDTPKEYQEQALRILMGMYQLMEESGINENFLGDNEPKKDGPTPNRNDGRGPRQ